MRRAFAAGIGFGAALMLSAPADAQIGNVNGHVTKVVVHGGKHCPFAEGQNFYFVIEGGGSTQAVFLLPNTPHGAASIIAQLPAPPENGNWTGTYTANFVWAGGSAGSGPRKFNATITSIPGGVIIGSMTFADMIDFNTANACDVTISYASVS